MAIESSGATLVPLDLDQVEAVFTDLGYTSERKDERSLRGIHEKLFNFVVRIDDRAEELVLLSFFPVKADVDRTELLEAVNRCNRVTTLSTWQVDDDGDVLIRCGLPAGDGFVPTQLAYLVAEGNREMMANLARNLVAFVKM